jgi:hypothetical protein
LVFFCRLIENVASELVPLAKSENLVFIDVILLVEKISKLKIVLFLIIQTILVILFLHHFHVF